MMAGEALLDILNHGLTEGIQMHVLGKAVNADEVQSVVITFNLVTCRHTDGNNIRGLLWSLMKCESETIETTGASVTMLKSTHNDG